MDFELSEEQQAIADLAGRILTEKLPAERLRAIESEPDGAWFAADVWNELARAGLLAVGLPEDVGGAGYGFLEMCLLLEQQGRTVAPLPLLPTLVFGALPIAQFGSAEMRAAWLPGVADGSVILTAALEGAEVLAVDGRLEGRAALVPAAHLASRVLVAVQVGESDRAVFVVDPRADGVRMQRSVATTGEPLWDIDFDGVAVSGDDRLGGAEVEAFMIEHGRAGLCAIEAGVCAEALRITAKYVSEREQFGTKIGTFQAVSQRAADAYIDAEAIALTARLAAWRLSEGLPAADEVAVAKYWAAEGGERVVHACQHLHGGIGVDIDYPIHRYFRWTKVIELTLGGATPSLVRLGRSLAATAV